MPSRLISFFAAGILVCAALGENPLPEKFRAVSDYKVIRADFVQTRHLAELNMQVEIRGDMICENEGRLRWQVKSPIRSITVIGPDELKHFDVGTGKLAVIQQNRFPWLKVLRECLTDWISGNPERLSQRFELSDQDVRTLRLRPKEPRLRQIFQSVQIRANARFDAIESIRIEENSGDKLEIRFENIQKNPVLPEKIWRMPPE